MGGEVITLSRESWRGGCFPASGWQERYVILRAEPVAVSCRTWSASCGRPAAAGLGRRLALVAVPGPVTLGEIASETMTAQQAEAAQR